MLTPDLFRREMGRMSLALDALSDPPPVPKLLTPPAPPPANVSEAHFQLLTEELAAVFGWWLKRDGDSRRTQAGWPDLVLVRERVLFREMKTEKGRLRPEQVEVGYRLLRAGMDWKIWRPSDWLTEIVPTLTAEIVPTLARKV